MKKNPTALLLFITFLPAVSSCVRDVSEPGPVGGEDTQVLLRLDVPEDFKAPRTRSMDFTSENTIDNIYVLVFDQSKKLVDIKQAETLAPAPGPDPNYVPGNQYSATNTFTVTLPPSTGSSTTKLLALANCATILAGTIGTDKTSRYIGENYDLVIAAVSDDISGQMYPGQSTGRIPMWGETGQIQITPGNNNQAVEMRRAVARIDVGVGQAKWDSAGKRYSWDGKDASGNVIPFSVTSVTVVRAQKSYAIIPARALRDAAGNSTLPMVPKSDQVFDMADSKSKFTFNATNGVVTYDIYVPEAYVTGTNSTIGDGDHQRRMAIVVGGKYNNSTTTTYYRIDFANNGKLMNVLRNNLYMFNIAGAKGPGFPSIEDAYASQSMNITANVVEWNQNNTGVIIFDGTNTLAVTPRDTVKLYGNQYTAISPTRDNAITIRTDVAAGWTIDRVTSANADGSDGTSDPSWITLSPKSGAANTKSDVTVSVSQNTTGASRTANVWIAADRLRYRLRVVQGVEPAIALRIVDNRNAELDNLTFSAPAGTAPAAQSFTVKWLPATNPVNVSSVWDGLYDFPNPGSTPPVQDGAPYSDQFIQPGNGQYTYTVAPPAITAAETASAPFLQKSTRFNFIVNNGFTSMTRSITLTQVNYALLVEQAPGVTQNTNPANPMEAPWYAQLGGRRFTYNVRSNSNWKISSVSETQLSTYALNEPLIASGSNATSGDNVATGTAGKANTTPGGGVKELFTTSNTGRGNSGYVDITYTSDPAGRFNAVTKRIFFPSAQFTVYGIVKMGDQNANFYNIFAGSNKQVGTSTRPNHLHPTINNAANFGTNLNGSGNTATPSSKVFTGPVNVNGVNYNDSSNLTVTDITDAVNAGADMLYISGGTKFGEDVGIAIRDNFLYKNKPVFLALEDPVSFYQVWKWVGAGSITYTNASLNGSAPVYQFNNIADPILQGPFRINGTTTLNGEYWGCDGVGSVAYWFDNTANLVVYSNAVNRSGNTDAPPSGKTMEDACTAFRFTNYPLIFAADGGFAGCFDTSSTRAPAWTDSFGNPALKNNYGGGSTKRNTCNAYFIDNVIAWAIQRRTKQ